jgi:hypothetical protein
MRVAAGVMLALYVGIAAVLSARELRFLAGVEPRQRRTFIVQDLLVQLAILGVLVPCTLAPGPSRAWMILVTSAFFLLWVAALWAVVSRSMYTYKLMLNARGEQRDFAELLKHAVDEERQDG